MYTHIDKVFIVVGRFYTVYIKSSTQVLSAFDGKILMRGIILAILATLVCEVYNSKGRRSGRCMQSDLDQLGGEASTIIANLERCLPDVIHEANMDVVEGCLLIVFEPDNISDGCKRCSNSFLKQHDLELRQCLFKCNGAHDSHQCAKCKELVASKWDAMCQPMSADTMMESSRDSSFGASIIPPIHLVSIQLLLLSTL